MSRYVFPDKPVFCDFAAVHRPEVLEEVLQGSGCWTQAVAYEVHRLSAHLADLSGNHQHIHAPRWSD